MAPRSLLQRVEDLCNVDVDDTRPLYIKNLPIKPHNQTSNPGIINADLLSDHALITQLVQQHGLGGWENVWNHAAVFICARNLSCISGRLFLQVSFRHADDYEAIIAHCHTFVQHFHEAGVPPQRYGFKIPMTAHGAHAAKILSSEGICILATAVFCLEQAIAASQAGCMYISPYYNETAAHLDSSLRPNYEDPALENPMSNRLVHILECYAKAHKDTGKPQPIMIAASFFTVKEILAMTEIGCPHITIPGHLLKTLAETPDTLPPVTPAPWKKSNLPYNCKDYKTPARLADHCKNDPLAGAKWNGKLADMGTDYVANKGANLKLVLDADVFLRKRFGDTTRYFISEEIKAKVVIEKEMVQQRQRLV